MVNGVEIRCEEKGSCPAGCHLCHHQAMMGGVSGRGRTGNSRSGEQPSPIPVLLEVSRVVPLYSLVQDNVTKEVRKQHGARKSVCMLVCTCMWMSVWWERERLRKWPTREWQRESSLGMHQHFYQFNIKSFWMRRIKCHWWYGRSRHFY